MTDFKTKNTSLITVWKTQRLVITSGGKCRAEFHLGHCLSTNASAASSRRTFRECSEGTTSRHVHQKLCGFSGASSPAVVRRCSMVTGERPGIDVRCPGSAADGRPGARPHFCRCHAPACRRPLLICFNEKLERTTSWAWNKTMSWQSPKTRENELECAQSQVDSIAPQGWQLVDPGGRAALVRHLLMTP